MLRVEKARVGYGDHLVLAGVDLAVGAGETVVVLGPSGCGKSTLLRSIAGLEPLQSGRIMWDDRDLTNRPPHERRFGLVFQDYALFPHRDVARNVEFGLRMDRVPAATRQSRVHQVLELVGLQGYEHRRVATLSGGEQQRVALARALAPSPRFVMFDEPLGALDRVLRDRLLDELRELLDVAALPALYVTHDHGEAFALADRVVLMRAGRVVQSGTPTAVWAQPADEWAATFLGFGPVLDADASDGRAATPWGTVAVDGPDGPVRVVLRPGAVHLDARSERVATVRRRTFRGDHVALEIELEGAPPVVTTTAPHAAPEVGERMGVAVTSDATLVYRR
jgi:thiamine transport system ATP-binding protein